MSLSAMLRPLALTLTATLCLGACEGDVPISTQSPDSITYAPILGVDLDLMTRTSSGLYWRDLEMGEGAEVIAGKTITVAYGGFLSDGTMFGSSNTGTFTFLVGADQVIKGWDEGLRGMRVGGRRQLIIPPALGYGSAGSQGIPGGAVLIFNIDLIQITGG